VSKSAEKLLEKMKNSKSGWGQNDLERLYIGFGFNQTGTRHSIFIHPKYPRLRGTVARHKSLAKGYISHAVKTIEELKKLETSDKSKEEGNHGSEKS